MIFIGDYYVAPRGDTCTSALNYRYIRSRRNRRERSLSRSIVLLVHINCLLFRTWSFRAMHEASQSSSHVFYLRYILTFFFSGDIRRCETSLNSLLLLRVHLCACGCVLPRGCAYLPTSFSTRRGGPRRWWSGPGEVITLSRPFDFLRARSTHHWRLALLKTFITVFIRLRNFCACSINSLCRFFFSPTFVLLRKRTYEELMTLVRSYKYKLDIDDSISIRGTFDK